MTLIDDAGSAARAVAPRHRAHVRVARHDDAPQVAAALAAAFDDDPVFRWLVPDDGRRRAVLPSMFAIFVRAYLAHGEVYTTARVAGAALWAASDTDPMGADAADGDELEVVMGVDAPRMFEAVDALHAHMPEAPHEHLQFLGVVPERQGEGIGSDLMRPVLARCDWEGVPAYLEATSARSRALYERHGFRVCGEIVLPDGPPMWPMWRDPAV